MHILYVNCYKMWYVKYDLKKIPLSRVAVLAVDIEKLLSFWIKMILLSYFIQ